MAKISGYVRYEEKGQNLTKLSKDIRFYIAHTGKTDKMCESNEIMYKLASCIRLDY